MIKSISIDDSKVSQSEEERLIASVAEELRCIYWVTIELTLMMMMTMMIMIVIEILVVVTMMMIRM